MTYEIGVVLCGPSRPEWPTRTRDEDAGRVIYIDNDANETSPCQVYQKILETAKADVVVFLHADVTVHDADWIDRILACLDSPACVAVGLGGATALGNKDLYRKSFSIWNMARRGYGDNQDSAETHGTRFTGVRRVAVLEAFCMAVRVDWLRSRGGWPVQNISHHGIDLYLACEAARDGKELWQVGARCEHHGGGTSTTPAYCNASWLFGGTLEMDHQAPHIWLAHKYRDVLPIETP